MTDSGRGGHYPSIIPYLLVADAGALIGFLELAFGAKRRFIAPSDSGGVMHGEVELGDGVLMLSDAMPRPGEPGSFCHYVDDVDAVYARAIAAGAGDISAPETKDYGDRVAGVKDPAGNTWWICGHLA